MQEKILVIDDDTRNIFALTAMLKAYKFHCVAAASAKEGLEILSNQNDIGIILIDMMMPDMDGYEAIPLIKKQYGIPVIAVTAQAMVGDREKCLQAGADDYVSKPIDVDRLLGILKSKVR